MEKVVIYKNPEGGVCVLHPTPETELTIEEIARKDTPAGVPYMILDKSALPEDRIFRNAWEADFDNPDGFGIGADAWFAEQESKK